MILYTKQPVNIQINNVMVLKDDFSKGIVYIDGDTFAQAVSMFTTFNNDDDRLEATLRSSATEGWVANDGLYKAATLFKEHAPKPLNVLGHFLAYAKSVQFDWSGSDEEVMEKCYGVLHILSQMIDFYQICIQPKDVRQNITLLSNSVANYKNSWNVIIGDLKQEVVLKPVEDIAEPSELKESQSISVDLNEIENKLDKMIAAINDAYGKMQESFVKVCESIDSLTEVIKERPQEGATPMPMPMPYWMPTPQMMPIQTPTPTPTPVTLPTQQNVEPVQQTSYTVPAVTTTEPSEDSGDIIKDIMSNNTADANGTYHFSAEDAAAIMAKLHAPIEPDEEEEAVEEKPIVSSTTGTTNEDSDASGLSGELTMSEEEIAEKTKKLMDEFCL